MEYRRNERMSLLILGYKRTAALSSELSLCSSLWEKQTALSWGHPGCLIESLLWWGTEDASQEPSELLDEQAFSDDLIKESDGTASANILPPTSWDTLNQKHLTKTPLNFWPSETRKQ